MKIAVAGGTGTLGKYVVQAALDAGHDATALSRRTGVDVVTGDGLKAALEGVEVVVDATNTTSMGEKKATDFFTAVTRNLQDAGAGAGLSRLVTLSIVNIDKVPGNPYYRAKLAHEAAARRGPLPVTIVRATQFHEFPAQVMARVHLGPVAFIPHFKVQTVAGRALGQVVADLAIAPPSDDTIDVAGPDVSDLVELARKVVARRGDRTRVVAVPFPGRTGRTLRKGALTPGPGARIVGPGFDEWLAGDDVLSVGG